MASECPATMANWTPSRRVSMAAIVAFLASRSFPVFPPIDPETSRRTISAASGAVPSA
jgi:hypothetical protein